MLPRPALLALLALALPLALGRRAAPGPAQAMPEPLPWGPRGPPGAAYAEMLRLLREGHGGVAPAVPQKRDMHDFFVGLMGKRLAERGEPRCSPAPPVPAA
ncbi:tachykinin-3 [Phaenicophaeus curvirostris]|uniref:tachykinin-3 n=1 Tax=Phaenicophaeus curvirostris TaxID=33595 RepID=UPI0037F0D633